MANGLPDIKNILRGTLSMPRNLEASLPQGMPKISSVLSNALDALPELPALPMLPAGMPALPTGMNGVTDFIKGIESVLPTGAPALSQAVNGLTGSKVVIGTEVGAPSAARSVIKIGI